MKDQKVVNIEEQAVVPTPVGIVHIAATPVGIVELKYLQAGELPSSERQQKYCRQIDQLASELKQYFACKRKTFAVPIDWEGLALTSFTESVLRVTLDIPYGMVTTYAQLAKTVGVPDGSRAVGNALGANPLPIIIPCHRVIRSDGSRGGYTGGLTVKDQLLDLERPSKAT